MTRTTVFNGFIAVLAALMLTGCIGYRYQHTLGGGVDYFIVDEVSSGPYYAAPYGTMMSYGAPGFGYYGMGGFYRPFAPPGLWYYDPLYRGYRHPYYYRPRLYRPPPRVVQRLPNPPTLPSQHERRRDWSLRPDPRNNPPQRRQGQVTVAADSRVIEIHERRNRPFATPGNRPNRESPQINAIRTVRPAQNIPHPPKPAIAPEQRQRRATPPAPRPVVPAHPVKVPPAPRPAVAAPTPRPARTTPPPGPPAAPTPHPVRVAPPPPRQMPPPPPPPRSAPARRIHER